MGNRNDGCCECRYQWYWTDGTQMQFLRWMINEPTGGQTCVIMAPWTAANLVEEGFYWFDRACFDQNRFICKASIGT